MNSLKRLGQRAIPLLVSAVVVTMISLLALPWVIVPSTVVDLGQTHARRVAPYVSAQADAVIVPVALLSLPSPHHLSWRDLCGVSLPERVSLFAAVRTVGLQVLISGRPAALPIDAIAAELLPPTSHFRRGMIEWGA